MFGYQTSRLLLSSGRFFSATRNGLSWWVRLAYLFWACCLVSAALSDLPSYSIGETVAWFRFPLFAMAAAFWLGTDRRIVHAMLVMIGAGMICMCLILLAEIVIVGKPEWPSLLAIRRPCAWQLSGKGELAWPYHVIVAFATSVDRKRLLV